MHSKPFVALLFQPPPGQPRPIVSKAPVIIKSDGKVYLLQLVVEANERGYSSWCRTGFKRLWGPWSSGKILCVGAGKPSSRPV